MWWESAIVFAAVAGSLLYLALRARRLLAGRSSCAASCGGCDAPPDEKPSLTTPLDFRAGFPPTRRS